MGYATCARSWVKHNCTKNSHGEHTFYFLIAIINTHFNLDGFCPLLSAVPLLHAPPHLPSVRSSYIIMQRLQT